MDGKARFRLRFDTLTTISAHLAMLDPDDRRMVIQAALQMLDGVPSLAEPEKPGVVINIVNESSN